MTKLFLIMYEGHRVHNIYNIYIFAHVRKLRSCIVVVMIYAFKRHKETYKNMTLLFYSKSVNYYNKFSYSV